ncbi:MAG: 30S ribosomal protein S12 methylthiotransferase RimO [Rikenellaceae bacterium]
MKKKIINIITLGCSKNTVDSEYLLAQLKNNGFEVVYDSDSLDAKVVIINTCGFIGDAKEESIETILQYAHAKNEGLIDHLFVMGCLSERYKPDLEAELPEVDSFFGVTNIEDIVKAVGGDYKTDLVGERVLTTPKHFAYLKISEGCNWGCSYCAIPLIRGKHISVPMEDLLKEAEMLAQKGVKELLVIAQDTTYYGLDLYGERKLGELLRKLCKIEGIEWIRLHYAYPAHFPQDVIEAMRDEDKICKYLDIPFQHASTKVLSMMRRGITLEKTQELIDKLRAEIPNIALRTTMIAGHPGEGDEEFGELREFVIKNKFDRMGVFAYSEEEGTHSAEKYDDSLSFEEKEARVAEIMRYQADISAARNESFIGKTLKVIIDRLEDSYFVGRSEFDSPEVDTEILIDYSEEIEIGNFYLTKIYNSDTYELYGKIVEK